VWILVDECFVEVTEVCKASSNREGVFGERLEVGLEALSARA